MMEEGESERQLAKWGFERGGRSELVAARLWLHTDARTITLYDDGRWEVFDPVPVFRRRTEQSGRGTASLITYLRSAT
jgi:hypothetical protein